MTSRTVLRAADSGRALRDYTATLRSDLDRANARSVTGVSGRRLENGDATDLLHPFETTCQEFFDDSIRPTGWVGCVVESYVSAAHQMRFPTVDIPTYALARVISIDPQQANRLLP